MIWLKGILFFVGALVIYKACKQLFLLSKEKQKTSQQQQKALIQCEQCHTYVTMDHITEYEGKCYCLNCINDHCDK